MRFGRKSPDEISGFLDQGTHVTGELQFSGTLRIDGNFHGSIATGDTLVVGEHAVVHADVTAGDIEIHGRIFGSVHGKRRVELFPTGQVHGDIHATALVIRQGGTFDGRSFMPTEQDKESVGLAQAAQNENVEAVEAQPARGMAQSHQA